MSDLPESPEVKAEPLLAEPDVTESVEPIKRRRSKLITRPLYILAEITFAGIFLVSIAIGGLMWRLSYGPIPLESVMPTIQAGLKDAAPGLDFKIQKAIMEPGNQWRAFNIRLYDVTVGNQDKETIGSLQEMVLGFSWRNFLNLTVIPSIIEIERPSLQVTRFEDGHIGFNLAVTDTPKPKARMPELAHLMATTLHALREIRVSDAYIHYTDKKDPFSFDAKKGLFILKRERNVISGTLSLNVKAQKFEQKIRGTIQYDADQEVTQFKVALKDLPPDQLADFLPQIPSEIQLKMPANILLTATIDKNFTPVGIDMQITGKTGTLTYPPYYPQPIQLSDLLLNAHYNLVDRSFEMSGLYAMLEKARLRAQASLKRSSDPEQPAQIEVLGLLEEFPVDGLKSYWPEGLAVHARKWIVDHLHSGIVDRAGLHMQGTLDKDNKFAIGTVGGKIKFHGMTVDYLPPMQPVENVYAEAQYDLNSFDIAVEKGELLKTVVDSATIKIDDFDKPQQMIALDINTTGPAQDVITIISSKPLEYPQKLGFNASQFSGNAKTNVHLRFPLLNDLRLSQVEMQTKGTLTDITVRNAVKDLTVSGKELAIEVDTNKLSLSGDAKLADAIAKVSWQENFGDEEPYTTLIDIDGDVTPAVLKGLRLPVETYFKGAANAKVNLKQDQKKTTFVSVSADINKAIIALPELRLEKKAGVAGNLKLDLTAIRNGTTTIDKLSALWSGFALNDGTVRWNTADEMDLANLKGMTVGRSKVDVAVTPLPNGLKAVIRGDVLDLSGYWTTPKDPNAKPSDDNRRYDLNLIAKTLYLDPDVPFKNMQAALSLQQGSIVTANIAADTDQDGYVRLKQINLPAGGRQLTVTAQNAGRIFQALDMTDSVQGGTLLVNGSSVRATPAVITGNAELKNFTIAKAPVLARIISAFSPVGLLELLNNKGLAFSKMSSQFSMEKPQVIRLKDGRMTGTSIGMSFRGLIQRDKQTVNLSGTIVPIEGLNKIVGKIPLIGQILTGLKGEGLIAATYKIKGKMDAPDVTVNPLSVLTPGILRSILFESDED